MKIAISGKMGSGKTTLADELVKNYGFEKYAFANSLKNLGKEIFGKTDEEVFGEKRDRKFLQLFGQKMREIEENIWIDILIRQIQKYDGDIVIDDVRFINEYDALKKEGFIMVRIESTEDTRKKRIGDRFKNPTDISETDLDSVVSPIVAEGTEDRIWDVVINNEYKDIRHFKACSDTIYKSFQKKA